MVCRFEGSFSSADRARIAAAIRAVESVRPGLAAQPSWTVFCNPEPADGGYRYGGVRLADGRTVRAHTAKGLAVAVKTVREEMLRVRSRALHEGSERVIRRYEWA